MEPELQQFRQRKSPANTMNYALITFDDKQRIEKRILLPVSKSEGVRLEFLRKVTGSLAEQGTLKEQHLPSDVKNLRKAMDLLDGAEAKDETLIIDIEDAGMPMRILTAYLACTCKCRVLLTGSERMQERPIAPLVNALRSLGAKIDYCRQLGYPPLLIEPAELVARPIELVAEQSSQYLSALLLIAPLLGADMQIRLLGEQVSADYPRLTAKMMRSFGARVQEQENGYYVEAQPYRPGHYELEADWSAAGYIYNMLLLQPIGTSLLLPGLNMDSIQADRRTAKLWLPLGIASERHSEGILLRRIAKQEGYMLSADLSQCPDLVPALVAACLLSETPFDIKNIGTLRLKESDRIESLVSNAEHLGYRLVDSPTTLSWDAKPRAATMQKLSINSYRDHRIAMALAPLAARFEQGLGIDDTELVRKSFPSYWETCQAMGLSLKA